MNYNTSVVVNIAREAKEHALNAKIHTKADDALVLETCGCHMMRASAEYEEMSMRRALERGGAALYMLSIYVQTSNLVQIKVKSGLVLQNVAIINNKMGIAIKSGE